MLFDVTYIHIMFITESESTPVHPSVSVSQTTTTPGFHVADRGVQSGIGWFTTGAMLLSNIAVVLSASELSFAPSGA